MFLKRKVNKYFFYSFFVLASCFGLIKNSLAVEVYNQPNHDCTTDNSGSAIPIYNGLQGDISNIKLWINTDNGGFWGIIQEYNDNGFSSTTGKTVNFYFSGTGEKSANPDYNYCGGSCLYTYNPTKYYRLSFGSSGFTLKKDCNTDIPYLKIYADLPPIGLTVEKPIENILNTYIETNQVQIKGTSTNAYQINVDYKPYGSNDSNYVNTSIIFVRNATTSSSFNRTITIPEGDWNLRLTAIGMNTDVVKTFDIRIFYADKNPNTYTATSVPLITTSTDLNITTGGYDFALDDTGGVYFDDPETWWNDNVTEMTGTTTPMSSWFSGIAGTVYDFFKPIFDFGNRVAGLFKLKNATMAGQDFGYFFNMFLGIAKGIDNIFVIPFGTLLAIWLSIITGFWFWDLFLKAKALFWK